MSSIIARLGPVRPRRTYGSLWKSSRLKKLDRQWLGAGTTLAKHRSYSAESSRWTARNATVSVLEAKEEEKQPRTESPSPADEIVKRAEYTPFWEHEATGDAFFSQRGPETQDHDATGEKSEAEDQEYDSLRQQREAEDLFERFAQTEEDDAQSRILPEPRIDTREGTSMWAQFEEAEDNQQHTDGEIDSTWTNSQTGGLNPFEDVSMLDLDYEAELPLALSKAEADMLIRCLFAAQKANDTLFIRSISETTFSRIIHILSPANFVAKLASTHVELSAALANSFGLAPMRQVVFERGIVLRQIVEYRREAGVKLTSEDYTALLRHARDLGSRNLAGHFWKMLLEDGHQPTTACYNHLMSAQIWNGVHSASLRQNVRIIPFHMMARQNQQRRFRNYAVGPGGLRETVMNYFNRMLSSGAVADEESFRILITACAREGDIQTAKTVMMKVWSIDVNGIVEGRDEQEIQPKIVPDTSPLCPTVELLWTIAHAFSINNDVPAALRVVDFVARHYQLSVTDEVWSQLFEWTFVLSAKRWGTGLRDGRTAGQLPPSSLMSLWETMTGPPYYVRPSMGMYNKLITNLGQRSFTPLLAEKMREGVQIYLEHRLEAVYAHNQFTHALKLPESSRSSVSIERLRDEFEYRELIRRRDVFWLRRWLHKYLYTFRSWRDVGPLAGRVVTELPTILWEFRRWIIYEVRYETATGFVEFETRTPDEQLMRRQKAALRAQERQKALDEAKKFVGHKYVFGRERDDREPRSEYRARKLSKLLAGSF